MKELSLLKKGSLDTRILLTKKPVLGLNRHSNPSSKCLVNVIGKNWATALVLVGVVAFTWKVFRCGGRGNLTMFGWLVEHTVFGSPIQYIPTEDYARELEGTWLDEEGSLRW